MPGIAQQKATSPQDEAGMDGVVYDPHSDPGIYMPEGWCEEIEREKGKGYFLRLEDTEISRSK